MISQVLEGVSLYSLQQLFRIGGEQARALLLGAAPRTFLLYGDRDVPLA